VGASLLKRGIKLKGGDLYIDSDLPAGAGLSSSASLEVGVAHALLTLAGKKMDPQQIALAAQWAEHNYAGVRCGIMDQSVVARGKSGHALMLDCRSLQVTHVPIKLNGWAFAVFDTNVRHKLAGSEYNKRRAECEHAAKVLGVLTLREATIEEMLKAGKKLTANEHKRVRHEISENIRTSQFADLLGTGDFGALGWLLITAHDYEVSCPELNFLAATLSSLDGCAGARMTGGGFGGSVVALVQPKKFESLRKKLALAYKNEMKRELGGALLLEPSPGAQVYPL
jgi:galactokinase